MLKIMIDLIFVKPQFSRVKLLLELFISEKGKGNFPFN